VEMVLLILCLVIFCKQLFLVNLTKMNMNKNLKFSRRLPKNKTSRKRNKTNSEAGASIFAFYLGITSRNLIGRIYFE
jgi:hypothetical protein